MTDVTLTRKDGQVRFERLVAFDVYDGPVTGVAFEKGTREPFYFSLQAWDDSQERRVFALSRIESAVVEAELATLAALVEPRWPEWWLQMAESGDQQQAVRRCIRSISAASQVAEMIVLTKNLLLGADAVLPLRNPAHRDDFAKLSRRSRADQEVADAPYNEWLRFMQHA